MVAILDAIYLDLWENHLLRDMLYQLSMFALSWDFGGSAVILYPPLYARAREARIGILDPVSGSKRVQVIIRRVNLNKLAEFIEAPKSKQSGEPNLSWRSRMYLELTGWYIFWWH